MGDIKDDELIIIEETQIAKRLTVAEYRKRVREALLIELSDIFDNTLSIDWKNWEISDFLNSYRNKE